MRTTANKSLHGHGPADRAGESLNVGRLRTMSKTITFVVVLSAVLAYASEGQEALKPCGGVFSDSEWSVCYDLVVRSALSGEVADYRPLAKEALLSAGHERGPELRAVADGVSYHFSSWVAGYGEICGEAHSPEEGTLPGRLVELVEGLRALADAPAQEKDEGLARIRKAADQLEAAVLSGT